MKINQQKYHLPKLFFFFTLIFFLISLVFSQIPKNSPYFEHYYFLSKSIVQGKFAMTDSLNNYFGSPERIEKVFDYAIYNQNYYLHLGIFPGIFGIIFLPLGINASSTIQVIIFLTLGLYLLTLFCRKYLGSDHQWLTPALLVASPVLSTLVWKGPWYLTGLTVFSLGLTFTWLYLIKEKRSGLLIILPLFLTRPTTIFYALIPLVKIIQKKKKGEFFFLIVVLALSLAIFFSYNFSRFGSFLEPGYQYVVPPLEKHLEFRSYETSIKDHLLSNTLYLFINPPRPNINQALRYVFPYFELSRYGAGLIFIIPWILPYLFFNKKMIDDWPIIISILAIIATILSFSGEGSFQIGPRYACDFLPLLIFLNFKWLSGNKKSIGVFKKFLYLGLALNLYFFFLVQLGHIRRV